MSFLCASSGHFKAHRAAAPVLTGSSRFMAEGRLFTRVSRHFVWVAKARSFFRACFTNTVQFSLALGVASARHAPAVVQPFSASRFAHGSQRLPFSTPACYRACFTPWASNSLRKTMPPSKQRSNPALNLVRFALWTLRDKAAQRRLALRWAS